MGLSLAGLAAPASYRLAARLLGHPPHADDLGRLRRETDSQVRTVLPGLPGPVMDTLLARVCRAPAPAGEPTHPIDAAVAGAVLAATLLCRTGLDSGDLPATPDPPSAPDRPATAERPATSLPWWRDHDQAHA